MKDAVKFKGENIFLLSWQLKVRKRRFLVKDDGHKCLCIDAEEIHCFKKTSLGQHLLVTYWITAKGSRSLDNLAL